MVNLTSTQLIDFIEELVEHLFYVSKEQLAKLGSYLKTVTMRDLKIMFLKLSMIYEDYVMQLKELSIELNDLARYIDSAKETYDINKFLAKVK